MACVKLVLLCTFASYIAYTAPINLLSWFFIANSENMSVHRCSILSCPAAAHIQPCKALILLEAILSYSMQMIAVPKSFGLRHETAKVEAAHYAHRSDRSGLETEFAPLQCYRSRFRLLVKVCNLVAENQASWCYRLQEDW